MANCEIDSVCPPGGKRVRRRSKLVNVRLASWNIGSLTGKSIELVKFLHRRRIIIAYIQETKSGWPGRLMGLSCGIEVPREPQMELVFWSQGIWQSKLWR